MMNTKISTHSHTPVKMLKPNTERKHQKLQEENELLCTTEPAIQNLNKINSLILIRNSRD